MREVVGRRYRRCIEEGDTLPDLIIADGGKGQMEAIRSVVEDELGLDIKIAGLVKDGKHRTTELMVGKQGEIIGLKQNSTLFKLMTQIQDEVHRFAITFHRDKRSKRQIASELDNIPGIGSKTKEVLLKRFKSMVRIRKSTLQDLIECIGESKGKALYENLKPIPDTSREES